MPIRPEERARYPKDWRHISYRIRTARALGRCECAGECGHSHHAGRCPARNGENHPITGSKVVLTVAHLDHQPEHCEDDNLKAMCQRCHLAYDCEHHRQTRRSRRACGDLFDAADVVAEMEAVHGVTIAAVLGALEAE